MSHPCVLEWLPRSPDLSVKDFLEYIKIKSGMYLNQNSQSLFSEPVTIVRACRNMPAVLMQSAFDSIANRRGCQNAAGHSFPDVINDQLALNLVGICLDNTLQILCKSLLCFANQKLHNVACKILYVQLQNEVSRSVSRDFNNPDLEISVRICFIQNGRNSEY